MSYLEEAEGIYNEYKAKTRLNSIPFNDAVIAFLYLFIRYLLVTKKK